MASGLSRNIYIVSHEEDIDGIGSAAIALRGTRSRRLYLASYRIDSWVGLGRLLRRSCRSRGSVEIIVSDLNPGRKHIEILAESLKSCVSKRIAWIDHHVWREEPLSLAQSLGYIETHIDRSRTSAENMASFLNMESDPLVRPLLELSRDTDYGFFKHPLSEPLTDVIRYSLYSERDKAFLRKLVHKFSRGVLWDHEVNAKWVAATERKRKALEDIKRNSREAIIGGYKALVILSDPMVSSRIALREAAMSSYDIAFVVYRNGSVTISRGSSNVNCAEIAWRLGGGGHPHIAGAEIDPGVVSKGLEAVIEYLSSAL